MILRFGDLACGYGVECDVMIVKRLSVDDFLIWRFGVWVRGLSAGGLACTSMGLGDLSIGRVCERSA